MKSILKLRRYDSIQEEVGAFKRYQIRLLLITQLANAAITGSMLCTVFDMVAPVLKTCYDDFSSSRDFITNKHSFDKNDFNKVHDDIHFSPQSLELKDQSGPALLSSRKARDILPMDDDDNNSSPSRNSINSRNSSVNRNDKSLSCACQNGSYIFDFYSISYQLRLFCAHNYIPTLMTSSVMSGGVLGSALFGFLADRHGRKVICIFALVGLGTFNGFLYFASYHWSLVLGTYLIMGAFGGGYMVVNMVLLLECVGGARYRLLCACLNGWPVGMMTMALLGAVLRHWLWFHMVLALLSFIFASLLAIFVYESPRWLITRDRIAEAENILSEIARINNCFISFQRHVAYDEDNNAEVVTSTKLYKARNHSASSSHSYRDSSSRSYKDSSSHSYKESIIHNGHKTPKSQSHDSISANNKLIDDQQTPPPDAVKVYSYLDLVRNKIILKRLSALSFCWLASSIISFGLFFSMGNLAGDRYINTFLIGLFKGTMGFVPFLLDKWSGRRPILVVSILITCLCCWGVVSAYFLGHGVQESILFPVLAIVGSAAIDPMWKINHLYSAELFPTVIRNMARAVCNVGSRIGSLIGPQMAYLSQLYFPGPFIIYGVLGLVKFVVVLLFLPETKGKPLDDIMPQSQSKSKAPTLSNIPV